MSQSPLESHSVTQNSTQNTVANGQLGDMIARPVELRVDQPRPKPRPPYNPGFLSKEQILEATDQVFTEKGYDGTTIRAIAKKLSCAVGSIYRYYKDKRELLQAVVAKRFGHVLEELESDQTTFLQSAETFLKAVADNSEAYRLMFWLTAPHTPAFIDELLECWSARLGYRSVAAQRFAHLHGLSMLGWSVSDILETMEDEPRLLTIVRTDNAEPAAAVTDVTPAVDSTPSYPSAEPEANREAVQSDDVTLL